MTFNFNNINSLQEFGKVFQNNLDQINSGIEEQGEFKKIFDEVSSNQNNNEIQQKLSTGISIDTKLDTINAQKIEGLDNSSQLMANIGSSIKSSVESLNETQRNAEHAVETLAAGGDISIHEVMIAQEKSNLAMQMAIQLRNQALNMFNEFKGMNI